MSPFAPRPSLPSKARPLRAMIAAIAMAASVAPWAPVAAAGPTSTAAPQATTAPEAPGAPQSTAPGAARETAPEWRVERDHWYRFELDGQPCGWMRSQVLRSADGALARTVSESVIRLARAGQAVEMSVRTEFDETSDGEPRAALVRQRMGTEPIEQTYRFDPADRTKVSVRAKQGGRIKESTITLPNREWMTPLVADAFAAARRAAAAREYTFRTLDLVTGLQLVDKSAVREGDGTARIRDREIPTSRWSVTDSLLKLTSTETWSRDDVLVGTSTTMALGRLSATLTNEETARASVESPAVELMVNTLVRPSAPIRNALDAERAAFRLRATKGSLPDMPSTGAQRVKRESPSELVVTVDATVAAPATDGERADARFTASSVAIDSNDEEIRNLAASALGSLERADVGKRAEALRRAVHRHVQRKGLASAFSTASETVRSRAGDCTEHALLLAALLRADGIPSRVVTGLVYCDEFAGEKGVFGWHMWTQALIDGRWVDLDATLPGARAFHAAHIATATSAQEQGAMDVEWTALINLIGNLSIEVLETAPRERATAR